MVGKIVYKIKWKSGGQTAERYSSKPLAKSVLKSSKFKGRIVKTRLKPPAPSKTIVYTFKRGQKPKLQTNRKVVWVRNKAFGKKKGFVYRTRSVTALQKSEKKRVVKFRR